jgi:Bacteriophage head to tail connecting protein
VGAKWSASDIIDRGDRAFARQGNWQQLCQAIAELFYPERADFTVSSVPGDERYWDIFDEEPMILRRDLANQIGAQMRPRGREWFKAKAFPRHLNESDNVRIWCEHATEITRDVIYASDTNFTRAFNQSDNDYVAFGTSILTHTYNRSRTGLVFDCLHPRDCAWEENSDGRVDVMHERLKRTLQQVDQLGFVIPKEWIERYNKDRNTEVEIRRCVYPVEYFDDAPPGGREAEDARGMQSRRPPRRARFAVMYAAKDVRVELKTKSGVQPFFRTWPYLVRRWSTVSGEPFGRSPCTSVALATARTLNQAQLSVIESLEKLVNPPLLAPDDGIIGEVQIRANGITFYDPSLNYGSRSPVEALEVGRPDMGMDYSQERRAFLARAFLQNLIRFPQVTKEMTAYEASKLWDQYIREAAPVYEPMEQENSQLMEGVFERIMDGDGPSGPETGKWGAFPPPPDELLEANAEVKFDFDTPMSEAYRRLKLEKAQEANAYIQSRLATNPDIVDLVDQDVMDGDALASVLPAKAMRRLEDVEAIRAEKQQKAQMEQMAALAAQADGGAGGGQGGPPALPAPGGTPGGDALKQAVEGMAQQ